jgi:hypothetical protein
MFVLRKKNLFLLVWFEEEVTKNMKNKHKKANTYQQKKIKAKKFTFCWSGILGDNGKKHVIAKMGGKNDEANSNLVIMDYFTSFIYRRTLTQKVFIVHCARIYPCEKALHCKVLWFVCLFVETHLTKGW